MAYLSDPTSKTDYGVVKIGSFINVDVDGIISIPQSVETTANVTFGTITDSSLTSGRLVLAGTAGLLTDDAELTYNPTTNSLFGINASFSGTLNLNGNSVVTSVTPTAGNGISLTSVTTSGPAAAFTVANTGVLSLIAGTGISISGSTGNITISSYGADLINVVGVTTNYTALPTDEYIGVNSVSAVTITLPTGITGRVYYIKDEHGQGSGKITIQPASGEKIDNATNYIISVPYQSVTIVYRGTGWWII